MGKFIDLTGQKFNKLTVLCKSNKRDNSGSIYWKCKCDCGNETLVITKHLKNGHTKSSKYRKEFREYAKDGAIYYKCTIKYRAR